MQPDRIQASDQAAQSTLQVLSPAPPAPPSRKWLADVVMIAVAVIWGLNNVAVKAALPGWISPLAFNAIRFSLGALAITALALRLEPDWRLPKGLWWKVLLLGLIGNGLNQWLFINGLARSTASNSGLVLALIPIMVAIIGGMTGFDRLTVRIWIGAAISFSGAALVVAISHGGFQGFAMGDLLLFTAGLTWAGYTVFAAPLAKLASPLKITAYGMSCAGLALLGFALPDLLQQDWSAIRPASWGGLLYAALLSNALGYGLYVWCVSRLGSTRAAVWNNLSPLVTATAAGVLLGESWILVQWLGVLLVLVGVGTARWEALRAVLLPATSK